jgi:electron transport complex protein RnfG
MIAKILRFAMLLTVYCVAAAASLAWVYSKAKPKIEENKTLRLLEARREVLPGAVKFVESTKDKNVLIAYDAYNKEIGKVASASPRGYAGPIEMIIGINKQCRICAVKILSQSETPGLGTRTDEPAFLKQFDGKNIKEIALKRDGGSIDAITGATISSKAVLKGIADSLGVNAVSSASPRGMKK